MLKNKGTNMKAKMAFIALAMFAGQAQAEWEYIFKTDLIKLYIDKSTIRNQSGYTLAWVTRDYLKPQGSLGYMHRSVKILQVAKCGEFVIGIKSFAEYSGNMGKGDVVLSSPSEEFHQIKFSDVSPGSLAEGTYNAICGIE